jgi:GAF domain-containing protein
VPESWLDIASLLKANQNLSQTVQLTDLLSETLKILLENAGAEKAFVLYQTEDAWFVEASGQVKDQLVQTMMHVPLSEAAMLSQSVCNYAIRSGQSIVLNNAAEDPQFVTDAYLQAQAVKSVLCLPIWHQGKLDLVLYLENDLVEGAFTEDRLELLRLLSGQMAISLANALMVDRLKASIDERERAEIALRESEDRLTTLATLSNELSKVQTLDELYRRSVEAGRERLGFDRVALWFFAEDHMSILGTYGTDAQGNTTDERVSRHPIVENSGLRAIADGNVGIKIYRTAPLYQDGTEIGAGERLAAGLWDGEAAIGF